jgi:hypothetical protein
VHETAMPEASRTHQLLYQQTQGGVLSYPFSLPAGIAGTTSELVVCLTTYDRGLQPLADLASHVCVMKTTVMHDRRTSVLPHSEPRGRTGSGRAGRAYGEITVDRRTLARGA